MPIDLALARQQLTTVRGALDALERTIATDVVRVHPGQSLQAVLDLAEAGTVVAVEPGAYEGSLTFRRPVTLRPTVPVPPGRRARDFEPVTLVAAGDPVRIVGPDVVHIGLAYRSTDPTRTLVTVGPDAARTVLDRPLVLGDAAKGQKRGLQVDGTGCRVLGAYVDDIWRIGQDSQALYGANGTRDLLVEDFYFRAAGECVMFGGDTSASPAHVPTGLTLTHGVLTKNPAWYAQGAQIKCALELKSARVVRVTDVEMAYAGKAEGQGGYLCVLTVRDQYGHSPWTTIEDVVIEHVVGHHAGGVVNVLGNDNNFPTGTLTDVTLRDWTLTDIDPQLPSCPGDGRLIQLQRAPARLTLEDWTVSGQHLAIGLHVLKIGQPPPTGLVLRRLQLPACTYGVKIDAGGQGAAALRAYAPDVVLEDVTVGGVPV